MFLTATFALLLASVVQAQETIVLNAEHSMTAITGTWASGYGKVVTGPVRSYVLVSTMGTDEAPGLRHASKRIIHLSRRHWCLLLLVSFPN